MFSGSCQKGRHRATFDFLVRNRIKGSVASKEKSGDSVDRPTTPDLKIRLFPRFMFRGVDQLVPLARFRGRGEWGSLGGGDLCLGHRVLVLAGFRGRRTGFEWGLAHGAPPRKGFGREASRSLETRGGPKPPPFHLD